jgi:MFS family permease
VASARWRPADVTAKAPAPDSDSMPDESPPGASNRRAALLLAATFAIVWFVSTAMAAHLPRLLQACGVGLAAAVAISALVGPSQVAGRLLEFGVLRRLHPLLSARLAVLSHPVGAIALLLAGAPLAPLFAVLHGAGNGILTIAKGTLPLALFGPVGYGARQGLLMAPSRFAQALAPVLFGLCLDRWGAGALWVSTALGLAAFALLMLLRHRPPEG